MYRSAFESPFIKATETYYQAESEQFLAGNSVTEYMKKAEARLQDEENRVDLYLHASTRKALIAKCEEVLVKNHAEIMQEEFQRVSSSSLFVSFRPRTRGWSRFSLNGVTTREVTDSENKPKCFSPFHFWIV